MTGTRHTARIRAALPLAACLSVVAVLYGTNLGGYPEFGNDDEGTYYAQAWAVITEGRLAHYTYWYDHPPLGWIQLAALLRPAQWLFGGQPALVGGRAVLGMVMVVSAALLYRVARNLGMPRTGASAVIGIWCLSPLVVCYGRQILLDNIALMWLLASLATATGSPRWRRPVLSGVCFGVAILSKETAALAGLGILVALLTSGEGRPRSSCAGRWLAAAGLVVGGWLVCVVIADDVLPLLGAIEWQLYGRGGSGSVLDPGSTARRIVASWWSLDPYLLSLGVIAAPLGLAWRTTRGVALIPVVLALAGLRPGGYLPAMHVITMLPFLTLLIGYAVWQGWRAATRLPGRRSAGARVAVVVLAATAVLAAAPSWAVGARTALTVDANAPYRQALSFVATSLPRDTVVLTDDDTWNDLVRLGWSGNGWDGAVWHYKLDRDPEAVSELPNGWRDVDYLLAGRAMESLLGTPAISWEQAPEVVSAWRNSSVVASWGPPDSPVVLRRVDPAGSLGCRRRDCPAREPAWATGETGRHRPGRTGCSPG
ncbi:ArnT family glycosyltransferase [Plantactinospora sp. KLBMP9567]|uniref:ArnT family glycosyltransferase n=1 Tax=Plantactinospora sp. KLBMP9567 TaxID=3085900 RepID=UPI002981342E|nr:glycosyltransferase family 39 protein [Plantactinospora sp. KLBMP9567]MDW5322295.1 glycosyltransferase family 39 protein [Plantactinospora sp. KLBMP9567]